MKATLAIIVLALSTTTLLAQKGISKIGPASEKQKREKSDKPSRFGFAVNLGTAFTFIPDFQHTVIVLPYRAFIPNYFHPTNGPTRLFSEVKSSSQAQTGWYAAVELNYQFNHNYAWHLSAGLKKLRYDYETTFHDASGLYYQKPVSLDDIDSEFGNTSLLYVTLDPSLSKGFLNNRLRAKVGATLNWLEDDETNSALAVFYTPPTDEYLIPDEMYFDTIGKLRSFVWGINLGLSYQIIAPIDVNLSGQFMMNSVYENEGLYETGDVEQIKPFVLQLGITIRPLDF